MKAKNKRASSLSDEIVYVDFENGNDDNLGTKEKPIRTIAELMKRGLSGFVFKPNKISDEPFPIKTGPSLKIIPSGSFPWSFE